jgi:IclR family transcriptional regulator, KDG regulon repressor
MPEHTSPILERAFAILDCFTSEQPELGVRETARLVGLSTSATGRMLASLKELGVLRQNPVTHAYSLGGRVLTWSGVYSATLDVRSVAIEPMHELHRQTRETISLYIMEGNERVCVERLESPENVRIVARIGRRLPLYAGSAGKVFLAFLPETRCMEILNATELQPLTERTFTDRAILLEELDHIRQQGYAVSYGEWILEASGVAAPIFDSTGQVIAALTISGPTQRFSEATVNRYAAEIQHVAAQISREMGFSTSSSRRNLR